MMIAVMILSTALPVILIVLNSILFKKDSISREKNSPFECGFDPKNTSRIPFSIRFYLVAVIFLIFDIEITLIMPVPMIMTLSNMVFWSLMISTFLLILLMGLYHEWNQGALEWSK